jgi:hypothetical protein
VAGRFKSRAAQALAPRERKVRDFDEDLSRFQRDQKSLFEKPKLLRYEIFGVFCF